MDAAERQLLADGLGRAVEARAGADLDDALAAMGWHDALADDPRAAVAELFERQGAAGAVSSALGSVLARGLGLAPEPGTAVVLPHPGDGSVPPSPPGRLSAEVLTVRGLLTAGAGGADRLVVAAAVGTGEPPPGDAAIAVVTVDGAGVTVGKVTGMDPWLGLATVDASVAVDPSATTRTVDRAGWPEAVRLGHLALGHELVGAAGAMLALATDHARQRVQFGRPIAGFQAVRHRLAEALVAVEAARSALDAAWERPTPQQAAMAKALAGAGARTVARHCQQVLAGIGFTAEHPFHRHLRRTIVLDELLGSARTLTRALGDAVLASGHLPPPPAL